MIATSASALARRSLAMIATLAAIALAVVGAATSSGAAPTGPAAPTETASALFPSRPTRVLALGDSVILGAASALPAALPGRGVTMDAAVSRTTRATATAAASLGSDWDVVIIQVAHNDGGSPGVYQPPYRQMLDQFASVPRVVLVTLHQVRPYYATVNQFIRTQAAGRPNVRVADWNAVNTANPGATAGDGLHLTPTGARLMAGLVADQVAVAEFEQIPTTTTPPTTIAPTTTEGVVLIPATSIVRSPTTSPPTSSSTTLPPAPPDPVAGSPGQGAPAASREGGASQDTPAWVWPLLLAGFAATAALAIRHKGTLPR